MNGYQFRTVSNKLENPFLWQHTLEKTRMKNRTKSSTNTILALLELVGMEISRREILVPTKFEFIFVTSICKHAARKRAWCVQASSVTDVFDLGGPSVVGSSVCLPAA